jgi:hypothetical protein
MLQAGGNGLRRSCQRLRMLEINRSMTNQVARNARHSNVKLLNLKNSSAITNDRNNAGAWVASRSRTEALRINVYIAVSLRVAATRGWSARERRAACWQTDKSDSPISIETAVHRIVCRAPHVAPAAAPE